MMQHETGELSRSAFRVNERNVNKLYSADKKNITVSLKFHKSALWQTLANFFISGGKEVAEGGDAATRDQSAPNEHIKRYTF